MLKGKTAIVTGASRGIGAAIALKLASLGADIAAVYASNGAAAEEICEQCRERYGVKAQSYACDVADFTQAGETIKAIRKDFGGIHILVNNAGVTRDGLVASMSEADFDRVIGVNLKGAFNMIRHCTRAFIASRSGVIVNISSVSGLMGNAGQANYAASKAGLIGLTKSVARELASRGIRCNAVAPGFIRTDMTDGLPEASNKLAETIPLGRFGGVEDVADAVAYLIGAEYVTGEVLRVDGGIAM
ncbi:MAG: 3-oxoacyl-[acyl-carrier-protein] reductase [Candidatus Faecivicinus sp.]